MVVAAVPVPVAGAAPTAPPPRRTDSRVDDFTDLAARLKLEVDEVRRALVGGRPELLPVFGEVSFADSTPAPGEMDGTDASNFAHTVDLPFPVLYRGAVAQSDRPLLQLEVQVHYTDNEGFPFQVQPPQISLSINCAEIKYKESEDRPN